MIKLINLLKTKQYKQTKNIFKCLKFLIDNNLIKYYNFIHKLFKNIKNSNNKNKIKKI